MEKTKIKVEKSYAKERLKAQIEKGRELFEKGSQIVREASQGSGTRSRDSFKAFYNQWEDFTEEILSGLFASNHQAREFRKTQSSKVEYVGSDWIPGVEYYLEKQIIPKLDYLRVLSENIEQFEKAESGGAASIGPQQAESILDFPERVTLAWLWRHVPVKLWASAAGLLVTVFLVGVSISRVAFVRRLLDPYIEPTRNETTRGDGIAQVLDKRTKELIAGHNSRVAELQKAIATEEHNYGVSPSYSHREAGSRLREDLKAEYQRYNQELLELRKLVEQVR